MAENMAENMPDRPPPNNRKGIIIIRRSQDEDKRKKEKMYLELCLAIGTITMQRTLCEQLHDLLLKICEGNYLI